VEKYFRVGQVTEHNAAHAHFKLDTWSYKNALTIRNTYCLLYPNSDYTNAHQYYVICVLPLLSTIKQDKYESSIYASLTDNGYLFIYLSGCTMFPHFPAPI